VFNVFCILLGLIFVGFMFYRLEGFGDKSFDFSKYLNQYKKNNKMKLIDDSGFVDKYISKPRMIGDLEIKTACGDDNVNEKLKELNEKNMPHEFLWK